jgi:hypothetical protein
LWRERRHDGVRPKRLKLDGVGARVGGRVDQSQSALEIAVVVHAGLGDDERRMSSTHEAPPAASA